MTSPVDGILSVAAPVVAGAAVIGLTNAAMKTTTPRSDGTRRSGIVLSKTVTKASNDQISTLVNKAEDLGVQDVVIEDSVDGTFILFQFPAGTKLPGFRKAFGRLH